MIDTEISMTPQETQFAKTYIYICVCVCVCSLKSVILKHDSSMFDNKITGQEKSKWKNYSCNHLYILLGCWNTLNIYGSSDLWLHFGAFWKPSHWLLWNTSWKVNNVTFIRQPSTFYYYRFPHHTNLFFYCYHDY